MSPVISAHTSLQPAAQPDDLRDDNTTCCNIISVNRVASIERWYELMEAEWGSLDAFLDSIGCDQEWRAQLREQWTEPLAQPISSQLAQQP